MRTILALLAAAGCLFAALPSSRADSRPVLVVPDRLGLPGEEIYVTASLYQSGLWGLLRRGIQGELLQFLDPQGNPVRDLLTDPSGQARIRYKAGAPGRYTFTVRLAENPRCAADPATGNLFVLAPGTPLFFVSVEAGLMSPRSTPWLPGDPRKEEAEAGAADALTKIAACQMPVYLTLQPRPMSQAIRSWLLDKGFPSGPVYFLDRPLSAGILSEAPPPRIDLLEALWQERSVTARLATRDRRLAETAADKGMRVFLLTQATETSGPSVQEEAEGEEHKKHMIPVHAWAAIPEICGCVTEETGKTSSPRD